MPRFEPFAGIRYDTDVVDLADVIAPPYDVIDADGRTALEERSPYNSVRVELARDEPGRDRYTVAGCSFDEWLDKGVLLEDDEPSFYVYRMGYHDEAGRARQTAGVIGALELAVPGEGEVLPHERTMPKPKDDRLNVLRSCRANLSPVWGLSLAEGLSGLCELPGPPDARATDDDGVHHRLWRVTQPGVLDAVRDAVASAPVVIADGHHRYETALAYQRERREANSGAPGDYDFLMAYMVELADEQLTVRPIHRIITAGPSPEALVAALDPYFEAFDTSPSLDTLTARMADAGALALVLPNGTWLLRPRAGAFSGEAADASATDSRLLDEALSGVADVDLAYQHDPAVVAGAVSSGDAVAGVLLRPATVAQIAATAHARRRMPEKTTFFHPKPRTGLVFRRVQD